MIDLNCDMGEQPDSDGYLRDESLMPYLGSCSIACGGHAGDAESMRITADNAIKYNLRLGAHPSYPDPEHFGRRALAIKSEVLSSSLIEQISALKAIVEDLGSKLSYVKPHGALYNAAASDPRLGHLLVETVQAIQPDLPLMGLAGSEIHALCLQLGYPFIAEGFADRAYQPDGHLVPRSQAGAVHSDIALVVNQVIQMANKHPVDSLCGHKVELAVESICVHSDTQNAEAMLRAIQAALTADAR
jgi:UPF0271 protein